MTRLLGIVGAVIATLLGLVVLGVVAGVTLLTSGALNGVIEEAIAAGIGRPAPRAGAVAGPMRTAP